MSESTVPAVAPTPHLGTHDVALATIYPSSTNPRKHFDKAALQELAESVRAHGVLQPVLLREKPGKGGALYELVAGERRFRAAKLAGLEAIPALVRELSDEASLEVQVIENLQRSDLHPLEEAEGYEQFLKLHHKTVEDLAAKVGKSKAYIYGRQRLLALGPVLRKAFLADEISASIALQLARIPGHEQQAQAWKVVQEEGEYGPAMTVASVRDLVASEYSSLLKDAAWALDDAQLVPAAGPCSSCPKRSSVQAELFGDTDKADRCTDLACFKVKREAFGARQLEHAAAQGRPVIDGAKAKKIWPREHSGPAAGYVDLNDRVEDDSKGRTYRQILKGTEAVAQAAVAVNPHDGQVHQVLTSKQAEEAIKAAGVKLRPATSSSTSTTDWAAKERERRKKETAKREVTERLRNAVWLAIAATKKTKLERADLQALALMLISENASWQGGERVLPDVFYQAHDFEKPPKVTGYGRDAVEKAYGSWVSELDERELAGAIRDLMALLGVPADQPEVRILEAAKAAGVDVAAIRKGLTAPARAQGEDASGARKVKPSKPSKATKANVAKGKRKA